MVQKRRGSPSGPVATEKTTVSIEHGDATAAAVTVATGTISGLRTTDEVVVNPPSTLPATLAVGAPYVSAANTISVPLVNPTAGAITAGTNTWDVTILRFSE